MLTLRQIEVVRAVMVTGSIAGASRLLNVAQPGLSRTLKHVESLLKVKLFSRKSGRIVPSIEARYVFERLQGVNREVDGLNFAIQRLNSGTDVEMHVGSVPSLGNELVPRAIAAILKTFPDLTINLDIIKLEDYADYLLLGKGELVLLSHSFAHAGLAFEPLATGKLVCIVSPRHELADHEEVSVEDIARYPLVGIQPKDPYGRIMVQPFEEQNLGYSMKIKARFGTTVCGLVKQNLGAAIIDIFTVANVNPGEIKIIPIAEHPHFDTFVARREDVTLSTFAEAFVAEMRTVMKDVMAKA